MNKPFDRVHDIVASYGRLLLPIPFSGGRWLMLTEEWKLRRTNGWGFHNCTRSGVH